MAGRQPRCISGIAATGPAQDVRISANVDECADAGIAIASSPMVQVKKTVQAAPSVARTRQSMPAGGGRAGARSVGMFVPRLTRAAFEKFGFSAVQLISEWPQIAGPDLARHTVPHRIVWPRRSGSETEDGSRRRPAPAATLHLRVEPARALEVQYGGALLIDRINAYFGYRAVGEIRLIQVAPSNSGKHSGAKPAHTSTAPSAAPDLGVSDPALAAALQRMRAGLAARRS